MDDGIEGDLRFPWARDGRGPMAAESVAERVLLFLAPNVEVSGAGDVVILRESDDERGLTCVVTAEAVELRLATIEWTKGAYAPMRSSTHWRTLRAPHDDGADWDDLLCTAVEGARLARERQFRRCRFCGEPTPPERRIDRRTCHACAEHQLGVVF